MLFPDSRFSATETSITKAMGSDSNIPGPDPSPPRKGMRVESSTGVFSDNKRYKSHFSVALNPSLEQRCLLSEAAVCGGVTDLDDTRLI